MDGGGAQRPAAEDCFEVMLQSRLSDGTMPQLSVTTAPLLLPLGVAGTTPSSMSEPARADKFSSERRVNMQATHQRMRSGECDWQPTTWSRTYVRSSLMLRAPIAAGHCPQ